MVRAAAGGDERARGQFARIYLDVVRAYLGSRWRRNMLSEKFDDAVQDVFLECFRADGALNRLDPSRRVGFRTFLYAIVRNVALRYEERHGKQRETPAPSGFEMAGLPAEEESLSRVFDRAWAQAILKRAGERQRGWARQGDAAARRRLDLLDLRFGDGLPIREIARLWDEDAAFLHAEFRKAREEFKAALREEVAFQIPGAPAAVEKECMRLLGLLEH